MIENMICMKQLSLLNVVLGVLFVLALVLKLAALDASSGFHSLMKVLSSWVCLPYGGVVSAVPSCFENTESPVVCCKYNKPIRNAILNFNKLVSDLDIETSSPDS